jgi:hypothetical protein
MDEACTFTTMPVNRGGHVDCKHMILIGAAARRDEE